MHSTLRTAAFAIALLAPLASAHSQIALDRDAVLLNPTLAAERQADIVVRNNGLNDMRAVVRLEDWDLDARGESRWQKPGQVAGSCGSRVSVSPKTIALAPGAEQVVHVSVQGHARFDAECWSAAVVEPVADVPNVEGAAANSTLSTALRATVPLYVTPGGAAVDGELRNMYVKDDSLELVYVNTGKMRSDIVGELQVRVSQDSVLMAIPLEQTTVLAGAVRLMRVAMPKLPKGKYTLYAIMSYGGAQMTAVEAALEIQ